MTDGVQDNNSFTIDNLWMALKDRLSQVRIDLRSSPEYAALRVEEEVSSLLNGIVDDIATCMFCGNHPAPRVNTASDPKCNNRVCEGCWRDGFRVWR